MNKKEREQLLRDTLDQCLSGLDSLPSDRAEVNRRLAENAPEIRHRIRFRRLAVPAVALVLCVCLIITGTQLGMIPWPDRIRPQETQVTTPPVLLAQPTGEGTENPESPAGEGLVPFSSLPAETREETENLFAGFFNAWKTNNINAMLDHCSPLWVSAQEDPKLALFSILQNRTPSDFIIESISGTSGDTERMVSTVVTMNYNNNKPETDFRMNVRMIREKTAWYIDPESLVGSQRNTTPEPEAALGLTALPQTGDPAVAEAEPDADAAAAEKYLREFFAAWHGGYLSEMYTFSGIGPFDPDHFASANTFNYLKSAYTPGEPEIESISGSAGDPVRTAAVVCRMTDSSSFSGLYRFMIDMPLQEDGLRRLDFRSLQSFDLLADHSRTVLRSVTWPYIMAMSMPYTLADSLVPLNLVSEKEGLRFEAIAAAAVSDRVMLIWSLQDSGENWGDPISASVTPQVLWSGLDNYNTSKSVSYYYDRLTKTCTVSEIVWLKTPLKGEIDTVTVSLGPVPVVSCETIDLLPYYTQYGSSAQTVDMLSSLMIDDLDNFEQYVRTAPHVLDYRHPLDIRLSDHILLGGIGDVDGLLHVQLHYTDNEIRYPDPSGSITCRKSLTSVIGNHALPRPLQWSSDRADSFTDGFIEYVLQPDPEGSGIPLIISTTSGYIQGGWSVDVPLSAIRTVDEDSWPSEAREEIEYKFAGFFNAWKTNNINAMLDLCSPLWVSAQENPQVALFNILQNRTPSEFIIESISGTPLDTDRMISAVVTMNYNNNKPEIDVRMNVRMIREKSAWYIDPESLVSFQRITTPEPEVAPSPAPKAGTEPDPDFITLLQETIPDCPAGFVPVGLNCEKEGFRLEVVYASVNEQSAFLIWSLQDLEGKHSDLSHDDVLLHGSYPWPYRLVNSSSLQYDDSSRTLWFAAEYQADTAYDPGEVLIDGLPRYLAEMTSLCFMRSENLAIGGLFEKYRDRAALVDVPELITTHRLDNDGNTLVYDTSWYRERGIRVLDYTHPLSVRLHKNLELSGVGLIDGQLHVQLHYVDDSPVTYGAVYYIPVVNAIAYIPSEPAADSIPEIPAMLWDTDGDGQVDYIEYVYPCESEEEARKLKVSFLETTGAVEGNWTIEIPLEKVWTGNPDADFLKAKAPEDIESWITQFFGAWELGEYNYMLDNCSPSWVSAQENPRQALFGNILVNRVPSSVTVESVSGSDEDAERMVTVLASMDYHNNKPDVETRLNVRIVRENGTWYVDPNSLVSHKVITTPEPEAEPSPELKAEPEPEPKPDPIALLKELHPDCLTDVVPVGLSCEQEGLRLELVSASVKEHSALFIWSLQDLEGDRLNSLSSPLFDIQSSSGTLTQPYGDGGTNLLYDASGRKLCIASEIWYDTLNSISDDDVITASISSLELMKKNILPIGELLREYSDQASFTDLPELLPGYGGISISETEEPRMYGTDYYRSLGLKVLDYTHPLSVSLHKYLELSGIGVADGQLHVQMHFLDNWDSDPKGYPYNPVLFANVSASVPSIAGWTSPAPSMQWDTDGDGVTDFIESVFPCSSVDEAADELTVFFVELTDILDGGWKIEVPLKDVWTGGTDTKGNPAIISSPADSGFQPCESPRSLDQIPLDLLLSLRPNLKDEMFPVNQYWTNGGPVRLEVISAAVGETESWVIYTIENGMPRDQCDLANGLDDSPLPESDITEHYLLGMVPALNEARFAARIRHSTPDPERKSVVFSVSDIDIVMRESIDNMKSLFLIYEPLSGGLADLPKSADSFSIITKNGEDITPGEFRKSGHKVLDSAHSPKKYLSNGLELSGIGLEEDGMLHIQLHTVEPNTGTIDGISWTQLYSWYLHIDYKVTDRGYNLTWTDPEAGGEYSYFEYIIPWTMEDFDRYSLRLDLFEKWSEIPGPVTLDISRPE